MITKKKLVVLALVVTFLLGLGGGYYISKNQSYIENLFGIKTWHTVTTFNLTMSNNTSPTFFISGEKWRITWEAIVPSASEKTGSNVDFGQISILIYNGSFPDREFAMRSSIWCDLSGHDVHTMGVHYIYEGKDYYFVKLRSIVLLPLALTVTFIIESYH
jgi:hypothetical protein